MSLQDRLNEAQGRRPDEALPLDGDGDIPVEAENGEPVPSWRSGESALAERIETATAEPAGVLRARPTDGAQRDPFAALKTRAHRSVIDRLGPRLFAPTA